MNLDIVASSLEPLLAGAWVTLQLTVISSLIGLLLAVPLALARLSRFAAIRWPATVYVVVFRGTPLLAQIFLIYYGSGQFRPALDSLGLWGAFRQPWFCAILALSLNTAAYSAEILRGAIKALPMGMIEAGRALGLSRPLIFFLITAPGAVRLAWPAYTNEVVYQLQATSLVSIITLMDLTGVARVIASRHFAFYEAYVTVSVYYLVLVYAVILVMRQAEKGLYAHVEKPPARGGAGDMTLRA
jgi:His/Glu/Gln/Arg/opine family amino acid ABC transporter permease subunit